jgi:hypothetical protein
MTIFKSINHTIYDYSEFTDKSFVRDSKLRQLNNEVCFSRFRTTNTNKTVLIPLGTEFTVERKDKTHTDTDGNKHRLCEYQIKTMIDGVERYLEPPRPFRLFFYTERKMIERNMFGYKEVNPV